MTDDVAWIYILPVIAFSAFLIGLIWKRLQDKTVEVVRNTIKPGELHVDDLKAYAATHTHNANA